MKRTWASLSGALAIFALALAIRSTGIDQDAAGDELYNYLAAKQFVAAGNLQIHHGEPYTRAQAFTLLIVGVQWAFGDSLVVSRIPAVLFGSLTAALLFWWLKREGHALAAWIAGILMASSPQSLILSQQVRFYTAQQAAFLLACILAYYAVTDGRSPLRRALFAAASLLLLALAVHLQQVTVIGVGGLGAFVLSVSALRWKRWIQNTGARRALIVIVALAGAGAVWLSLRTHLAEEYAWLAGHADLWAKGAVNKPLFYFWRLKNDYPAIVMLFPLLAVAAAAIAFRLALLSLLVFCVAFVAHSLLPWKADRYFDYAMPFFFALGGLGWARVVPLVRGLVARLEGRPRSSRPGIRGRTLEGLTLAALALSVVASNDGFERTAKMLRRDPRFTHPGMESGTLSWTSAAPRLQELADEVETVVSSADTKALYYIGRADYVLNRDHVADVSGTRPEFTSYSSVGIPVLSTPESMLRVVQCHRNGILVVEAPAWGVSHAVPRETADAIEANLQPVAMPPEYGLKVFRWATDVPGPAAGCPPRPDGNR